MKDVVLPPLSAVFYIAPDATATRAPIMIQGRNGKGVPIGVLNPTEGTFAPTTESFMAWWKTLPTTPPTEADQPWNNGGMLSVS